MFFMVLFFENILNNHISLSNTTNCTLDKTAENLNLTKTFTVFLSLFIIYIPLSFFNFDVIFIERTAWGHALFGNNSTALNATQTQENDNYIVDLFVSPPRPIVNTLTNFTLEIKSKVGDVLIELPVAPYILKDGKTVFSNPNNYTLVQQQHYDFDHVFNESGTYSVAVDIKDIFYTLDIANFVFEIEVNDIPVNRIIHLIGSYYYVFIPVFLIIMISIFVNYRKRRIREK